MAENRSVTGLDIAIVGGGLVGASLALALRGTGLRVAVVEAFAASAHSQPSYDDRTLVINEVSGKILQALGLANLLDHHGEVIHSIHVSDRGRPGRVLLHAEQHGRSQFGHVVIAREIGRAMLAAIVAGNAADELLWLAPAKLVAMQRCADGMLLQLTGAQPSIKARLVVGADGADSRVRQLCGMPASVHDYRQQAIICNATPQRAPVGRAYERFTESGPLALLPQPQGRVGVVMCLRTGQAEAAMQTSDTQFLQQLQDRFGQRLGKFMQLGKRASYPLRLVLAEQHVRERVVLIGNAAHTIHPVSAQGFNLGLRDAWQLAAHCRQAQLRGDDFASARVLEDYQRSRAADQQQTIRYTDTLARLYVNPGPLAGALRGAALLAHQFLPGLQRGLVTAAMGYRDQLQEFETLK